MFCENTLLIIMYRYAVPAAVAGVCPGFGEPGWGPFCFLNGNPVFQAFDVFQAFIQGSVVSLHDVLQASFLSVDLTWNEATFLHR